MEPSRSPYRVDVLRVSDVYPEDEEKNTADTAPAKPVGDTPTPAQDTTQQSTPQPETTTKKVEDQAPQTAPTPEVAVPAPTDSATPPDTKSAEVVIPIRTEKKKEAVEKKPHDEQPSVTEAEDDTDEVDEPVVLPQSPSEIASAKHDEPKPQADISSMAADPLMPSAKYEPQTPKPAKEPPSLAVPDFPAGLSLRDIEPKRSPEEEEALANNAEKEPAPTVEEPHMVQVDTEPILKTVEEKLPTETEVLELPPDIWEEASTTPPTTEEPQATVPEVPVPPVEEKLPEEELQNTDPEVVQKVDTVEESPVGVPAQNVEAPVEQQPQEETDDTNTTVLETPPQADWEPLKKDTSVPNEEQGTKAKDSFAMPPTQEKQATSTGVSLAALRDKVLHQGMGTPLTKDVSAVDDGVRKTQLAQSDLQMLKEAHAVLDDAEQEQKEKKDILTRDDRTEGKSTPTTKHAMAIAGIAQALQGLHTPNNAPAATPENREAKNSEPEKEDEKAVPGAVEQIQPTSIPTVPTMRTFQSDVEQTVRQNQISVVDMISSEENRRAASEGVLRRAPHQPRLSVGSYMLLGASVTLLISGAFVGLFYYLSLTEDVRSLPDSIFVSEQKELYDATDKKRLTLMEDLTTLRNAVDYKIGTITEFQMTERIIDTKTEEEELALLHAIDFLEQLETHAPSSLVRSLDGKMMLGVHEHEENEMFLILLSDYYENTFSGMLEWEEFLEEDLAPLFIPGTRAAHSASATTVVSTSTVASSTTLGEGAETTQKPSGEIDFEDIEVNNIRIRGLRDANGEVSLMWAMYGEDILIITTSELTFEALRNRMNAFTY